MAEKGREVFLLFVVLILDEKVTGAPQARKGARNDFPNRRS
jgi:hypothetical protein